MKMKIYFLQLSALNWNHLWIDVSKIILIRLEIKSFSCRNLMRDYVIFCYNKKSHQIRVTFIFYSKYDPTFPLIFSKEISQSLVLYFASTRRSSAFNKLVWASRSSIPDNCPSLYRSIAML